METGKKLSYAVLHNSIHVPQTGTYGPVLCAVATGSYKPVNMTQLETQVLVEIPDSKDSKKLFKILIDNSGFTHRVLAE
jgi:hypothetical protein